MEDTEVEERNERKEEEDGLEPRATHQLLVAASDATLEEAGDGRDGDGEAVLPLTVQQVVAKLRSALCPSADGFVQSEG